MKMQKRRDFIKTLGKGLVGSAAFGNGILPLLANAQASAGDEYKALICINLAGGNDGFNTLVPIGSSYENYAAIRQDLALPKTSLHALNNLNSGQEVYGLHPALAQTARLFNFGHLACVGNIGNLVEPVTRASYFDGSVALPAHLFSHNDQAYFTQTLNQQDVTSGWAGRVADAMEDFNVNQQLAMNISLSGDNAWQRTAAKLPYGVRGSGVSLIDALSEDNPASFSASRAALYRSFISRNRSHLLQRHYADVQLNAWVMAQYVSDILKSQPVLDLPILTSTSAKGLLESLGMVVRFIAAHKAFEVKRQIFFVDLPGFDTHRNQLADQQQMLQELDQGLGEFHDAMTALGYGDQVTVFTQAEFGRTLSRNGNNGTDHGWTNHHLVMGGAVRGQRIYGSLPEMAADNDHDIGEGRIIPQSSFDQYAATLSQWFGVNNEDLAVIFPNLQNFAQSNLGFIA